MKTNVEVIWCDGTSSYWEDVNLLVSNYSNYYSFGENMNVVSINLDKVKYITEYHEKE